MKDLNLSFLQSERKEIGDYSRQALSSFTTWFTVSLTINLASLSALYASLFSGHEGQIFFIKFACFFFVFANLLAFVMSFLFYKSIKESFVYLKALNISISEANPELKNIKIPLPYIGCSGTGILAMITTIGLAFSWGVVSFIVT